MVGFVLVVIICTDKLVCPCCPAFVGADALIGPLMSARSGNGPYFSPVKGEGIF